MAWHEFGEHALLKRQSRAQLLKSQEAGLGAVAMHIDLDALWPESTKVGLAAAPLQPQARASDAQRRRSSKRGPPAASPERETRKAGTGRHNLSKGAARARAAYLLSAAGRISSQQRELACHCR